MKNIYELPTQDKNKYKAEFNTLPLSKEINKVRTPLIIVATCGAIIYSIILELLVDFNVGNINNIILAIIGISAIIYAIYTIYYDVCFYRWLKIKHKIEN